MLRKLVLYPAAFVVLLVSLYFYLSLNHDHVFHANRVINQGHWTNWANTAKCWPQKLYQPSDISTLSRQVTSIIQSKQKIRPVGAGTSPSESACTDAHMINLDKLSKPLHVSFEHKIITVQGGMRLNRMHKILADNKLSLPIGGFGGEQSVGAAVATSYHGTGLKYGSLGSYVNSIEFISGQGRLWRVTETEENKEYFHAAVASLGSLGIAHVISFDVEAAFLIHRVEQPFGDLEVALDRALGDSIYRYPYMGLVWLPGTNRGRSIHMNRIRPTTSNATMKNLIETKSRTDLGRWVWFDLMMRIESAVLELSEMAIYYLSYVVENSEQIVTRIVQEYFFQILLDQPIEFVDRSDLAFNKGYPSHIVQLEYFFPIEHTMDVMMRIADWFQSHPEYIPNMPAEISFVKMDHYWISPFYKRDSVGINFNAFGRSAHLKLIAITKKLLIPLADEFEGRPHWGKIMAHPPKKFSSMYPKWEEFLEAHAHMDPDHTYSNEWIARILGLRQTLDNLDNFEKDFVREEDQQRGVEEGEYYDAIVDESEYYDDAIGEEEYYGGEEGYDEEEYEEESFPWDRI
eukprot:TRINITY_DN9543_c0_g1_i1.p1 TRINITY_DN9543_c0_g1~~TRINITY_DN9543_c0_g1_i1.p1  ORF type:complete len:573 (+),score=123.46 TRINITY_DN9543_c0_g1_i1:11-1729(+)